MDSIIKFRGKRIKDGKWIFGNLADYSMNVFNTAIEKKVIFSNIVSFATDNFGFVVDDCAVAPDTIGQFTGLCDKNGKEIYEGDIFTVNGNYPKKIEFRPEYAAFCMANLDELDKPYLEPWQRIRPDWWNDYKREICIIGNIHDNSSLISDKQ